MKTVNVIILSGSCCNPQFADIDKKVQMRIEELANKKNLQVNIRTITISSAAFGGLGLGKDASVAVRNLISSKGMSVLPIVFFNNKIAFYGGLASVELIEEKLDLA